MASRDEIFEMDQPETGVRRGRRRSARGLLAAVLITAALGAAVLTARDVAGVAAPADHGAIDVSPPVAVLDETGIGQVRLGMTIMEYRRLAPTQPGDDLASRPVAFDYGHGCLQYESSASSADVVWVWFRDNVVVAVGVETRGPSAADALPASGLSVLGARLGQPMAAVVDLPQRWSWDGSVPPRLASRPTATGTATLADIDADGLLDYAQAATAAAEDCDVDPRRSPELQAPTPGPAAIDGQSLLGVSLGSAADSVTTVEGWFELGSPRRACRRFAAGDGAGAQALDGRVVALSADRLVEGPAVGDTLAATLQNLGLTPRARDVRTDGWEVVSHLSVLSDGRPITVDSARPYRLHEQLDRSYPVGEPTVRSITVGRPCGSTI